MIERKQMKPKTTWLEVYYKRNKISWLTPENYTESEQLKDLGIKHTIVWLDNSTYLLKEWTTEQNRYGDYGD